MREVIINNEVRFDAINVDIGPDVMAITLDASDTLTFDIIENAFSAINAIRVDDKEYRGYTAIQSITKIWSGETTAWSITIRNVYAGQDAVEIIAGSSITYDEAIAIRKELEELAESIDMTDDQYEKYTWLFPEWSGNQVQYKVDDKVKYLDKLYKCLQAHTSQPAWNPVDAASLWANVLNPDPVDPSDIPVWTQPSSTNPYMTGDMVRYPDAEGAIYKSTIDYNIWSPRDYPQGWAVVE